MQAFIFVVLASSYIATAAGVLWGVIKSDPDVQFQWAILKHGHIPEDMQATIDRLSDENAVLNVVEVGRINGMRIFQLPKE